MSAHCPSCFRPLPAGFPGATVSCECGMQATLPAASIKPSESAIPLSGGPYRAPSSGELAEVEARCTYCGNGIPPLVRVCPHCDVRLDNVRCTACYTLQAPGAFACGRCGHKLELEPMLDPTDAPCPRCETPLEASAAGAWDRVDAPRGERADQRLHECARCGGLFVPQAALAEILCRAELAGPFSNPKQRPVLALDQVKYVKCPLCHTSMNRVNFGKMSGVIVDVCRAHGTWFDAGELTRIVAFAATGGLARTRERETQEKKEQSQAVKQAAVMLALSASRERTHEEQRLELWRTFLHNLFW